MSSALDSTDRKLLLFALTVLVVTVGVAFFFAPKDIDTRPYPSSYSASSGGSKAIFLLLQELDYKPERWRRSPEDLLDQPVGSLLVLAEPVSAPTGPEKIALERFLTRGGRILATGFVAASMLPQNSVQMGKPHFAWQHYKPETMSRLTRNVHEIVMAPTVTWLSKQSNTVSHFTVPDNKDQSLVVSYHFGKGEIIWLAAADPMTNSGVQQGDNLTFLLNCIGEKGNGNLLWDEYYHEGAHTVIDSIADSPLKWAGVQLLALFVFMTVTYSRRHGPIRKPVISQRLSPLEFVDTMGGLYDRAEASDIAVEVSLQRFRQCLQKKMNVTRPMTNEQLAETVKERWHSEDDKLIELLQLCETNMFDSKLTADRSLVLVQELHRYIKKYELEPKKETK